jgi:uncharacterized repeat protein (TIGR02543 family)
MSKKKLAAVIIACIIGVILVEGIACSCFNTSNTGLYTLTTNISPSGAGSVSPSGGEYESGAQVTLTASPASGYTFDHWSGSASGTTSTIIITMDSDKSVTANFKNLLPEGILFEDYFDDNRNNWGCGEVYNGSLHIEEFTPEGPTYISTCFKWPSAAQDFTDFGYEVEVTTIEADDSLGRGITFLRDPANKEESNRPEFGFLFLITGNGHYTLIKQEGEESHYIVDWTKSSYIEQGNSSNTLKVICLDSIITLYVNSHVLEQISGEFPDTVGDNGIGLVTVASGGVTHYAFDNMKMWVL